MVSVPRERVVSVPSNAWKDPGPGSIHSQEIQMYQHLCISHSSSSDFVYVGGSITDSRP